MKKFIDYNHVKNSAGLSMIDIELDLHRKHEKRLRKFLQEFNPSTHGISAHHPLADILEDAWNLKADALRELNRRLPGIIYEVPRFRDHLVELSHTAMRALDPVKAQKARTTIKSIALPITETAISPPITPHTSFIVQMVAEDFYLVDEVFKAHRDADPSALINKVSRTFEDVPKKYIAAIGTRSARLREIIRDRVGEITGSKGRGEYDAWSRANPNYTSVIKSMAAEKAATIRLY